MLVRKEDYVQFKNSMVYSAARQDVGEGVSRALAEMVNSEDLSLARHNFLKGFIAGSTALLDWEPEFVEDQPQEEEAKEDDTTS